MLSYGLHTLPGRTFVSLGLAFATVACAAAKPMDDVTISAGSKADAGNTADAAPADAGVQQSAVDSGFVPNVPTDAGNVLPGNDDAGKEAVDSAVPDGPCDLTISETFDTDALPDGWSIANVGTSFTWQWLSGETSIPNKTESASTAGFYLVNSYDKGTPYDARFVSPMLSVASCAKVSVSFDQYLSVLNSNMKGSVEVRAMGGEWQSIQAWDDDYTGHDDVDLTAALIGKTKQFQLAFRYEDAEGQGIYWQIDDVKIQAE